MRSQMFAWSTLVALLVIPPCHSDSAESVEVNYPSRLASSSSALRCFQAEFDGRYTRIPLPRHVLKLKLQLGRDNLDEQSEHIPASYRRTWRSYQCARLERDIQRENKPSTMQWHAKLIVDGPKFYWSGPRLITSYNGREMFVLTIPSSAVGDWGFGKELVVPGLHILPQFSAQQGQHVPFYGLLNPSLPMFAISDLSKPHRPGQPHWWRVQPTGRYGGNAPGLVELDQQGHVHQFQVFAGEPQDNNRNLLERWTFSQWQQYGVSEFPKKIEGDWFTIPPFGLGPTRRTVRREHMELSLNLLTLAAVSDRTFSIWQPPHRGLVYDDRYRPARRYLYGMPGAVLGGSLVEPKVKSDRVARLPIMASLLAVASVLQAVRVRLRKPTSRSTV